MASLTRTNKEHKEKLKKLAECEQSCKVEKERLEKTLKESIVQAQDQLKKHLMSEDTQKRFREWSSTQRGDIRHFQDNFGKKIAEEVSEWQEKNEVFAKIQRGIHDRTRIVVKELQNELDFAEAEMGDTFDVFFPKAWSKGQTVLMGFAMALLLPFFLIAFLVTAVVLMVKKNMVLAEASVMALNYFATDENVQGVFKQCKEVLEEYVQINLNGIMERMESYRNLLKDAAAKKESIMRKKVEYESSLKELLKLRGKLNLFSSLQVRKYDVSSDDVMIDWAAPVASGSFVYKAKWNGNGVAAKVHKEPLSEDNVIQIMAEESMQMLGTYILRFNFFSRFPHSLQVFPARACRELCGICLDTTGS